MTYRRLIMLSLIIILSIVGSLVSLSARPQPPVQAQPNCGTYYQCAKLGEVSAVKVQGPITYWFDDSRIDPFLSPKDAADFKAHLSAAASDWAVKTGVSITETSGSGKVRIIISTVPSIRNVNGEVAADQSFPGVIRMTFSNEWPEWNDAGKDRLASHEWGHVIGFVDVSESTCLTVETIMHQFSSDNTIFDNQLKGAAPLPAPGRPNACDACAAKDKQAGVALGTSCPTPSPSPSPSPSPTPTPHTQELFCDVTSVAEGAPERALPLATLPMAPEVPVNATTVSDETTDCDSVAFTVTFVSGDAANARQISAVPLC